MRLLGKLGTFLLGVILYMLYPIYFSVLVLKLIFGENLALLLLTLLLRTLRPIFVLLNALITLILLSLISCPSGIPGMLLFKKRILLIGLNALTWIGLIMVTKTLLSFIIMFGWGLIIILSLKFWIPMAIMLLTVLTLRIGSYLSIPICGQVPQTPTW